MKIYARLIPLISRDIIQQLRKDGDIEVKDGLTEEAELDIGAVMRQYLEEERRVIDETKNVLNRRELPYSDFARIKKAVASRMDFKAGDEGIDWVIDQVMASLLSSRNIDEVFAEDHDMRKKIHAILVKYLLVDEDIDREARSRIKNLQEGTYEWDVEYEKNVNRIKKSRGLIG